MTSFFIYVAVFTISASMVSTSEYKKSSSLYSIIGLGILILFAAGRYHVGTDSGTYNQIFKRYSDMSWLDFLSNIDSEPLFAIIVKATYDIGGRVLTWGTLASLTAIPTYCALKDEYKDICIEIAFFVFCISYYATAFNITRQFVAVAFVFWGIKYVYKNKLIPFLATVLVATGFHTSALIAVLIWFMWDHKQSCAIKGTKRFGVIIVITIAVIYYQEIITFFASSVSIFESYDGYAETSLRGKNRDLYVSILECVITYIIGYQMLQEDEKLDFMFSLLLIATLIGFTGFRHPQVKRIAYYFYMPSRLVLCGYLPYCFAENSILLSKFLICSFYVVLFVLTAFILAEGKLVPYRFDLFSAW